MDSCIIRGPRACFNRVETGADRMTYPCITPSAVVGIISSIYDHPGLFVDVREIWVLNPIEYQHLGSVHPTTFRGPTPGNRHTTVETHLRNPKWLVKFNWKCVPKEKLGYFKTKWKHIPKEHFETNPHKASEIFQRRLKRGQFYYPPALGQNHLRALVEPTQGDERPIAQTRQFGMVLHGIDFRTEPITPYVFDAQMHRGVIDVPSFHDVLYRKQVH